MELRKGVKEESRGQLLKLENELKKEKEIRERMELVHEKERGKLDEKFMKVVILFFIPLVLSIFSNFFLFLLINFI